MPAVPGKAFFSGAKVESRPPAGNHQDFRKLPRAARGRSGSPAKRTGAAPERAAQCDSEEEERDMNAMSNAAGPVWVAGSYHGTAAQGGRMPGRLAGAPRPSGLGTILAAAAIASLVAVCAATMPAGIGSTEAMVEAAQEWQYLGAVHENGPRPARRLGLALVMAESNASDGAAMFYAAGEGTAVQRAAEHGGAEGAAVTTVADNGGAEGQAVTTVAEHGGAEGPAVTTVAETGGAEGDAVTTVAEHGGAEGDAVTTVADNGGAEGTLV
jgi:hypothetical protein